MVVCFNIQREHLPQKGLLNKPLGFLGRDVKWNLSQSCRKFLMVDYIETLKNAECNNLRKRGVFYLAFFFFLEKKIQSKFNAVFCIFIFKFCIL